MSADSPFTPLPIFRRFHYCCRHACLPLLLLLPPFHFLRHYFRHFADISHYAIDADTRSLFHAASLIYAIFSLTLLPAISAITLMPPSR